LINKKPNLIYKYKNLIITPNENEFLNLKKSLNDVGESDVGGNKNLNSGEIVNCDDDNYYLKWKMVNDCSKKLGGVCVFRKGLVDLFDNGQVLDNNFVENGNNGIFFCDEEGSGRRCGGQGDILSGS
jgi:ATP-dependent NAD(P)H-hydrate dehydratase